LGRLAGLQRKRRGKRGKRSVSGRRGIPREGWKGPLLRGGEKMFSMGVIEGIFFFGENVCRREKTPLMRGSLRYSLWRELGGPCLKESY